MKTQRFTQSISAETAVTIAKCADHVAGFSRYSLPCLTAIFNAQTQLISDMDKQVANHCEHYGLEVTKKVVRFDCTDSPGTFSMCIVVDCEFIRVGDRPFIVYWLDGKLEHMEGKDIQDAFMGAGVGTAALSAVDFYVEATEPTHVYVGGEWVNKLDVKEKVGG